MTRGLAFLAGSIPAGYGGRLACLRWERAARADVVTTWREEDGAETILAGVGSWVIVCDPTALPNPSARIPEPPYGRILLAEDGVPGSDVYVHTLRELEGARLHGVPPTAARPIAAMAFWPTDFPPAAHETLRSLWTRLLSLDGNVQATDPAFRVIRFDEPSLRERPELTRRLPDGDLRILDVGCGSGGGIASAGPRRRLWKITGIEKDPYLAAQAGARCDRIVVGDLRDVLPRLASDGERFDVLVFADVLEHLEDPIQALQAARPLAASQARLLVSVPNAGHLSLIRDLLAGRFDPVPSGLLDVGHLRWFTREFLAEVLEEGGWRVVSIQGEPGAPPGDPEPLRQLAKTWPDCDPESLRTYQWIAEARTQ